MFQQGLQENQQQVLLFRFKRHHSQIQHQTIRFQEQPHKIRKITNKFIKNIDPISYKKSQLFLKKYELTSTLEESKQQPTTNKITQKQYQLASQVRNITRKQIIQKLRQNNANSVKIINMESKDIEQQAEEDENQEEEQVGTFYVLQTRERVEKSNQKSIPFPQQLMECLDSEKESIDSFSSSDRDSDYEDMRCEISANHSWKQTVNGKQVEYVDNYSNFTSRLKNKKYNMS